MRILNAGEGIPVLQCSEDDPKPGRPSTGISPENIATLKKLVMEIRRITLHVLQEATGLRMDPYMLYYINNSICPRYARWVPRMLSDDMKLSKFDICEALITRNNANTNDFLFRVITCDKMALSM